MGVLAGNTGRQNEAASKEDKDAVMKDQDKSHEDEFFSIGADLSRRMEKASEELTDSSASDKEGYITPINPLSSNKEGESYKEDNSTIHQPARGRRVGRSKLQLISHGSRFGRISGYPRTEIRYPKKFRQQLWNDGGPSVKSMKILLGMIKTELKGKAAGLEADMSHFSTALIDFMIEEASEDSNDALAFLEHIAIEITQWEEEYSEDNNHAMPITKPQDALPPDKEAEQFKASKTQGTVPRAPKANPAEGIAATITKTVGEKEGPQSLSMAAGG
jgi:hypothetical protein